MMNFLSDFLGFSAAGALLFDIKKNDGRKNEADDSEEGGDECLHFDAV